MCVCKHACTHARTQALVRVLTHAHTHIDTRTHAHAHTQDALRRKVLEVLLITAVLKNDLESVQASIVQRMYSTAQVQHSLYISSASLM